HALQIQLPPSPDRRIVARRQGEALQQTRFEAGGVRSGELDCARRRAQHDQRLEPGDVIEEPATGGEHAQRVALELEQLTGPRQRASIVGMSQPLADEARDGVVRRSQNGAIDVPNRPWVRGEDDTSLPLEHAVQLCRQPIERAPLRSALDWLAAELHRVFEREGGVIFSADPWTVRDVYGAVLGAPDDAVTRFIGERLRHPDDRSALARARELLELERHALRMFTSCGWFFDDIAGLESLIVLRSAARAIELAGTDAASLEAGLLERLALAPSNDPAVGTGRELYLQGVKAAPSRGVPI